ncbi:hypothetical protein [Micromonospora sp. RTP1Z1]|uniref:hypothetical protein n=1 Tax=Micromonospora sp. RTP1Z1 TaxID=2994043 RepID=UPI0029C707FD|nr:hypothetical protein [Micromonospora sp. RTP1Z1]
MENTGYPCPGCGAPADLAAGCPGCGRPPYPPAAEVTRLDREIAALAPEVERARATYQDLLARLDVVRQRRTELAARIRLEIPPPQPGPVRPVPVPPSPAVARPAGPRRPPGPCRACSSSSVDSSSALRRSSSPLSPGRPSGWPGGR